MKRTAKLALENGHDQARVEIEAAQKRQEIIEANRRIEEAHAKAVEARALAEQKLNSPEDAQAASDAARDTGDFDLIRRNAVFPSAGELLSILTILTPPSAKPKVELSPSTVPEVEARPRAARASLAAG